MEPWSRAKSSPRWACTHTGALAVNLPPLPIRTSDGATAGVVVVSTAGVIGCGSGFKMPGRATLTSAHSVVRQTRGVRTLRGVTPSHITHTQRCGWPAMQRERRQEAVQDPPFILSSLAPARFQRALLPFIRGGPMRASRVAALVGSLWGGPRNISSATTESGSSDEQARHRFSLIFRRRRHQRALFCSFIA